VRIIRELDFVAREGLKRKHEGHELFDTHIKFVIDKSHCYAVNVYASDYKSIMILSYVPDTGNNSLSATISYIQGDKDFFAGQSTGLKRAKVREYLEKLTSCSSKLKSCFTELGDCFVVQRNGFEVTDGMHRLVAYGLASGMKEDNFPIPIYLGSDNSLEIVETGAISSS